MTGIVAYSLYKQEKIKYIKGFKADHNDADPDETDLDNFHTCSKLHIAGYRHQAQLLLHKYAEETLSVQSEELGEIAEAEIERARKDFHNKIKSQRPSFWMGVVQSMVGSVGFAILIAAILMTLVGMRIGLDQVAMEMLRLFRGVNVERLLIDQAGKNSVAVEKPEGTPAITE